MNIKLEKILAIYAKAQEKIANSHPEQGESQGQMEERVSIAVYAANEIKGDPLHMDSICSTVSAIF